MKGGHLLGRIVKAVSLSTSIIVIVSVSLLPVALAVNPTPQSGSVGLEGTIPSPPPTRGATVTVPGNNAVFTSIPITVSGLCPTGLLIKVFDNGVFSGSSTCSSGSYNLQVDLFNGQNNILVWDYDALGQPGPQPNAITITYNDSQFLQFGSHISLSSDYAENGASPGTELTWPVRLSGGTGPFAISVDWGDGTPQSLLSTPNDGTIMLKHTYKLAGTYTVIVKAVDKNGETALLQLVGQATGAVQNNFQGSNGNNNSAGTTKQNSILLWPTLIMVPLIIVSFWIGRKYENKALRKHYLE